MSSLEVFCIVLEQAEDCTFNSFAKAKNAIRRGVSTVFVGVVLAHYNLGFVAVGIGCIGLQEK